MPPHNDHRGCVGPVCRLRFLSRIASIPSSLAIGLRVTCAAIGTRAALAGARLKRLWVDKAVMLLSRRSCLLPSDTSRLALAPSTRQSHQRTLVPVTVR